MWNIKSVKVSHATFYVQIKLCAQMQLCAAGREEYSCDKCCNRTTCQYIYSNSIWSHCHLTNCNSDPKSTEILKFLEKYIPTAEKTLFKSVTCVFFAHNYINIHSLLIWAQCFSIEPGIYDIHPPFSAVWENDTFVPSHMLQRSMVCSSPKTKMVYDV